MAGDSTQLTLASIGSINLTTKIGVAKVTITASGIECIECMVENREVGGVMEVSGSGGRLRFTSAALNVNNCTVTSGQFETEPLKITTFASGGSLMVELSPVSGTTFAEVEVDAPTGQVCPLGTLVKVTGHADGTFSGATLKFATGAGELLVGSQEAKLTGELTVTGGVTGGDHHPLSITEA